MVDRVDGAGRGDKFGLVNFSHDAGFSDCDILFCGLESCGFTESDDRETGADRVTGGDREDPEEVFERTDRVETLA